MLSYIMGNASASKGKAPSTSSPSTQSTANRKKRALQSDSEHDSSPSVAKKSKTSPSPGKRIKRDIYKNKDVDSSESDSDPNDDILRRGSDEIIATGLDLEIADMTNQDDGFEDWSELELALFNKLNKRGFEPLFQTSWQLDFDTLPDELFTTELEDAYFKAVGGSEFRASKALLNLLTLGARVREIIYLKRRGVESYVAKEIKKYIKWSHEDAKDLIQNGTVPILTVVHGTSQISADELIDRATANMVEMHKDYENASAGLDTSVALPCIFCIVVSDAIIQLLAMPSRSDREDEEQSPRTLAIFDFRDSEQDVWNSLAVAIIVIFSRDWIISPGGQKLAKAQSDLTKAERFSELGIYQEKSGPVDPDL